MKNKNREKFKDTNLTPYCWTEHQQTGAGTASTQSWLFPLQKRERYSSSYRIGGFDQQHDECERSEKRKSKGIFFRNIGVNIFVFKFGDFSIEVRLSRMMKMMMIVTCDCELFLGGTSKRTPFINTFLLHSDFQLMDIITVDDHQELEVTFIHWFTSDICWSKWSKY